MNYDNVPLILTVEDIARLLLISKNTAYNLVQSGQIKSVRVGRQYRISQANFFAYVNA